MRNKLELTPHPEAPFIGVCPGEVRAICFLQALIHDCYQQLCNAGPHFPYLAITGRMQEDKEILRIAHSTNQNNHLAQMIPHCHPEGVLLYCTESRKGATVVCQDYEADRAYLIGDLNFERVKEIQTKAKRTAATFHQVWTAHGEGRIHVPFLLLFPRTYHYRVIDAQKQFKEQSNLYGWALDSAGKFQ